MSQDTTGDNLAPQDIPANLSDAIFARRLRSVREQADMTQRQLADMMTAAGSKMHATAIAKIEAGDRSVTVGEAIQLATILGVPLMELVRLRKSQEATEVDRLTDELIHAIATINRAMAMREKARHMVRIATDSHESAIAELNAAQEKANEIMRELDKSGHGKEFIELFVRSLKEQGFTLEEYDE